MSFMSFLKVRLVSFGAFLLSLAFIVLAFVSYFDVRTKYGVELGYLAFFTCIGVAVLLFCYVRYHAKKHDLQRRREF